LTVPTNDKNSGKLTGSVFYRKLAVVIIGTETDFSEPKCYLPYIQEFPKSPFPE
jgi:hypothetical protein